MGMPTCVCGDDESIDERCVCLCVCMCMCLYVCVYVCVGGGGHGDHLNVETPKRVMGMPPCVCGDDESIDERCVCVCVCLYVCVYVCMCVCVSVCMCPSG